MGRRTVDFGIDLGTTNSAIALMVQGEARIFKNFKHSEITPSAVRLDENGSVIVGQNAYDRLYSDPDNTAASFKLLMGTRQAKTFARSGRVLKPEELSAEVLKDLKATVRLRVPEEPEIKAAVITVPCYFEMTQSQATARAAKLAGIEFAPLLQEPIAASIAYGYLEKMPEGYWVVYDLGGGTFDVALLSAKDGHLMVIDHGGDNYLGGHDFDWRIVEEFLYPALRENFDLPDLGRSAAHGLLNALLKYAAEEAKIKLSVSGIAEIVVEGIESLKDRRGKTINLRVPITSKQLNCLIADDVEKSFRIFRDVLTRQNLKPADISRLILVGGPTQIPYVRDSLKQEFGIPADHFIDPMTIVARGAAIYAGTQLLPSEFAVTVPVKSGGPWALELKYEPMTISAEASVAGRLKRESGEHLPAGTKIQVSSTAGDWQSPVVEIQNDAFFVSVHLREDRVNHFIVTMFDAKGGKVPLANGSFSIHQGLSVGAPPLARSIGVELVDGSFDRLLQRGTSLPAKATYVYHAAKEINPGQETDALDIPVREGEGEKFEHNRYLGTLVIRGSDVHRKVPVNADIEVTLFVDASRNVSAEAFIPVVDQKFSMKIPNMTSPIPDLKDLEAVLGHEEKRWKELLAKSQALGIALGDAVGIINKAFIEVSRELAAAVGGDAIAVEKADRRIRDLKTHLDSAQKAALWPALLKDYQNLLEDVKDTVESWGRGGDYQKRFELLCGDAQKAETLKDTKRLQKALDELRDLKWEILFRQKEFWTGAFQELRNKDLGSFQDRKRAAELLEEGARALARQDTESVQSITLELWKLISRDDQALITSAVNSRSGIKRKSH